MDTVLLAKIVKVGMATFISSRALRVISGKKEMGDLISGVGWLSVGIGIIQLWNQLYVTIMSSELVEILVWIFG